MRPEGTRCIEPDEVTDYLSQDNPKAEGLRAIAGDRIYGMYGNAIYFPRGGTVSIDFSSSATEQMAGASGLTLSFWLKPLQRLNDQLVAFGPLRIKTRQGRVQVRSRDFETLISDQVLRTDSWTHIGIRVNGRTAELWIDGERVASESSRWQPRSIEMMTLGQTARTVEHSASFLMDEVRLSDVFRTRIEMGDAAFVNHRSQPVGINELNLDVYMPQDAAAWPEAKRSQATELGRKLFFSRLLSSNDRISCASCHQPEKAFTDGRTVATGVRRREGPHAIRR